MREKDYYGAIKGFCLKWNLPEVWNSDRITGANLIYEVIKVINAMIIELRDYENRVDGKLDDMKKMIDDFLKMFDEDLSETVKLILVEWKDSGILDGIINDALFNQKLDKKDFNYHILKEDDDLQELVNSFNENIVQYVNVDIDYELFDTIFISNKKVVFYGKGSFFSNVSNLFMFEIENTLFEMYGLTINGKYNVSRGMTIQNSNNFILKDVKFIAIGNSSLNNVNALYISYNSNNGLVSDCSFYDIQADQNSTAISVDNFRNTDMYSKNLNIFKCTFKNILANDDGDGIKIIQGVEDVFINVENNNFIKCSKRSLKVQGGKVISKNNTYVDGGFSFQNKGGVSEGDYLKSSHYNPIEISGDVRISDLDVDVELGLRFLFDVIPFAEGDYNFNFENISVKGNLRNFLRLRDFAKINDLIIRNVIIDEVMNYSTIDLQGEVNNIFIDGFNVKSDIKFDIMTMSIIESLDNFIYENSNLTLNGNFKNKKNVRISNNSMFYNIINGKTISSGTVKPSQTFDNAVNRLYFNCLKGDYCFNENVSETNTVIGWVCVGSASETNPKGVWLDDHILSS